MSMCVSGPRRLYAVLCVQSSVRGRPGRFCVLGLVDGAAVSPAVPASF